MSQNELKLKIESALQQKSEPLDTLEKMIGAYAGTYPEDLELYSMKAQYFILRGDNEKAYLTIKEAIGKNPYNREINLMAREICEKTARYEEAIRYETALKLLGSFFSELPDYEKHEEMLLQKLTEQQEQACAAGDLEGLQQQSRRLARLELDIESFFGLYDIVYGGVQKLIGTYYENCNGKRTYNAIYNDVGIENYNYITEKNRETFDNWLMTKLECREVVETKCFSIPEDAEYLLPVLMKDRGEKYTFVLPDGREIVCRNKKADHFEYYRVPPATRVESEETLFVGNAIPMKADPEKKKLVLNIFLDGFSQKVIEEENFEEIMPLTAEFFSKGIRCTNAYTAAEWTLPSIASYTTGLSSVNHMLIHNKITNQLPQDVAILAEYFKEQGYQTAKIDGDWRSTQSYGYGRGMDRIIYQHQCVGMRAEQVIPDALDHIALMKDTNQFVWMCVGDLHDVADGCSLKASTQAAIPLEDRADEEIGITSVKQKFSKNKRSAYIRQMRHIDDCLGVLYRYIEENYRDEEILISLFGDHGQGYLVEEQEHFLAKGRSKVGLMFRSDFKPGTICEELLSTCDYLPIMCKLAGIPQKEEKIDGKLPVFFGGGEAERAYTITESIHPGDKYEAAVVSKEYTFFLTSEGKVGYDGRFKMGDYQGKLINCAGHEVYDEERKKYFAAEVLKHVGHLRIV